MGYSADYFSHIGQWLECGWIAAGQRLIEFGAQEFYGDPAAARAALEAFLAARGIEGRLSNAAAAPLQVSEIFRLLGIDYMAIDVDGAHGSLYFDLNAFAPPPEWIGAFDMVNNEGTIEHLINPANGFQVAHELLKVGGIARHSIPIAGCPDHGLFYPTPKFYGWLIGENRYELLDARMIATGVSQIGGAPLFTTHAIAVPDLWVLLSYRKTSDAPFRFFADHLTTPEAWAISQRLAANMAEMARARLLSDAPGAPRTPMTSESFTMSDDRAADRRLSISVRYSTRDGPNADEEM